MVKHVAAVTVDAPAADLFQRLSRFETYPQIFTFLHDVESDDAETIPERRIGWRSADGSMSGHITLEPEDDDSTVVTMTVLGGGPLLEGRLQHDLDVFARMVEKLPPEVKEPLEEPLNASLSENAPLVPGTTPREVD